MQFDGGPADGGDAPTRSDGFAYESSLFVYGVVGRLISIIGVVVVLADVYRVSWSLLCCTRGI